MDEKQPQKLRELASWYRELAERTANPAIWDGRLRTAEDLETEAGRIEQVIEATSRSIGAASSPNARDAEVGTVRAMSRLRHPIVRRTRTGTTSPAATAGNPRPTRQFADD
jgi:hypothetical protein